MNPISIVITEDHALLRDTWSFIFNKDCRFKVVGVAGTGEEAINLAKQFHPDIILMDINLPGISGIEATEQIKVCSPSSKILAVSCHSDPSFARKMIQKGAMGYLTKNSSCVEMFKAISEIVKGKKYVCDEIKNILAEHEFSGVAKNTPYVLSVREMEIIESVKKGWSSKLIAQVLKIAVKTVEVHRYNILHKLHLPNTAAMVNYMNNSQVV